MHPDVPATPHRPPATDGAALPDPIRLSHARCAAFGLRAYESADLQPLDADALEEARARNQTLYTHALPVIETLHGQIAGTQSMVLLTDAQGVILHALGDDDLLGRANRVALRPGAVWSEQTKGTNAIGTALLLGDALQVHGDQHFLRANHFLTCSCAPILDPQGRTLGALDVSGDHRSQSPHTMALVRMAAQMVENHLFGKAYEQAVRLRFHARAEFLGTLVEGLAAFAPDGRFLSANRSGQFQLGMSLGALRAHTFSSLFGLDIGVLLAHCRSAGASPLALHLPGGVQVTAQAEFHPRGGAALPVADAVSPAPKPAPARPRGMSSLRYLDTGDAQLAHAIERVTKVLGRDVAVLVLGETGTGKELLARAIHEDSPRRGGPFVAVNCASIPESLIESELFGYEEGAFTGARRKGSAGKILQAHGGTLFLDEIGDMPLTLQARLLRVLQERSVAPLGGARERDVDLALVCATHRNLREMMADGRFRDDLYYRLNGLVVKLPPLRERTDLGAIVERMLLAQGSPANLAVAPEAMALFQAHPWPGNLRQLANVLRTAVLMAEGERWIRREHLPDDLLDEEAPLASMPAARPAAAQRLDALTAGALDQTLALHRGNVSAAARALGVSRNTVYRHLRAQQQRSG
jgi:transcriptional regulator of acetoin/glycerol metabolism